MRDCRWEGSRQPENRLTYVDQTVLRLMYTAPLLNEA